MVATTTPPPNPVLEKFCICPCSFFLTTNNYRIVQCFYFSKVKCFYITHAINAKAILHNLRSLYSNQYAAILKASLM